MKKRFFLFFLFVAVHCSTLAYSGSLPYRHSKTTPCFVKLRHYQRAIVRRALTFLNKVTRGNEDDFTNHRVQILKISPVREIATDVLSLSFLKEHKVYISLTTSPKRISKIKSVLDTLDLTHVEEIIISLPERFGRDDSEYVIPEFLENYPKIRILRTKEDYGPATKLIPAVEYLKSKDSAAVVITVDDDTGYPKGMVNEMIYAAAHFSGAVIGRYGRNVDDFKLRSTPLPRGSYNFTGELEAVDTVKQVDIVEGYGAIVYPVALINTSRILEWGRLSPECKIADDLVISLSLFLDGIPRLRYTSRYNEAVTQFHYGFQDDAIHRGAGLFEPADEVPGVGENYNTLNYRKVFQVLAPELELEAP